MPKLRKNRIREERIHNEIIVDAYGPEEQALGWYYYLENREFAGTDARTAASCECRLGRAVDCCESITLRGFKRPVGQIHPQCNRKTTAILTRGSPRPTGTR